MIQTQQRISEIIEDHDAELRDSGFFLDDLSVTMHDVLSVVLSSLDNPGEDWTWLEGYVMEMEDGPSSELSEEILGLFRRILSR